VAIGCVICDRETAASEPPGGWVLRSDRWSACVAEGFEAPGWLFLQTLRHTEGPMTMDNEEAGELGLNVAHLSGAIQAVTGAEKVYVVAYGERFPHFHLCLFPRMPFAPPEHTGPGLFTKVADLVDVDESARVARAIREALGTRDQP
jgi:diadenosine tetraphosphate (Ap4A) HIT family hydrolase